MVPRLVDPIINEPYQAEVFVAEYEPIRRKVCTTTAFLNDQPLPLLEGIATIRTTFPTPGPHTLRLRFRRERCRDGSVTEVSRDFTVNVLERCNPTPDPSPKKEGGRDTTSRRTSWLPSVLGEGSGVGLQQPELSIY